MSNILSEMRPCYVNGERAIFHKWIKNINLKLNCSRILSREKIRELINILEEYGFIQGDCEPVIIEETLAIIEYVDGRVRMVKPHEVRFADKKINDFIFQFQFDEHCGEIISDKE
ncbi:MAG: hypothetical protein IJ447_02050 [Clostridia bacterium]|nr:hypothetical protein [Clostridia bacterium]